MSFFSKFWPSAEKPYEEQREDLQSADLKRRLKLARNTKTEKEILYYLAEKDPEAAVRKAVAENKSMPVHASPILAADQDQDVRLALAGRLVKLLPGLSDDKHSHLYAFVVQALGTLALDEVLKIRKALSATLKDHAHTPPKVAGQLARDVEREVSEPILRFCAAVSDKDLLKILQNHPAGWAIEAIAARVAVSEPVSEAVIGSDHKPAGTILIGNKGAELSESLLQTIVAKARNAPEWHEPMAMRAGLPYRVAKEMAEFVDASVRDLLITRENFDEEEVEEIAAVFRRRVDFASGDQMEGAWADMDQRLKSHIINKTLNEEIITDALAMRESDFVYGAIGHLVQLPGKEVQKIFEVGAAKPVVAISWKAGLSMRTALQLQKNLAFVPPKDLIYPKGGTEYPLTQDELIWQLEFLGLKAA